MKSKKAKEYIDKQQVHLGSGRRHAVQAVELAEDEMREKAINSFMPFIPSLCGNCLRMGCALNENTKLSRNTVGACSIYSCHLHQTILCQFIELLFNDKTE